jgi:hypothetical protein
MNPGGGSFVTYAQVTGSRERPRGGQEIRTIAHAPDSGGDTAARLDVPEFGRLPASSKGPAREVA